MTARRQKSDSPARKRATPKGRRVDPGARDEVRALLGDAPRRRDLLIEHLHKIQDRFGCLSAVSVGAPPSQPSAASVVPMIPRSIARDSDRATVFV